MIIDCSTQCSLAMCTVTSPLPPAGHSLVFVLRHGPEDEVGDRQAQLFIRCCPRQVDEIDMDIFQLWTTSTSRNSIIWEGECFIWLYKPGWLPDTGRDRQNNCDSMIICSKKGSRTHVSQMTHLVPVEEAAGWNLRTLSRGVERQRKTHIWDIISYEQQLTLRKCRV